MNRHPSTERRERARPDGVDAALSSADTAQWLLR